MGHSSKAYRVEQLEKQGVGIKNKIMRCSVHFIVYWNVLNSIIFYIIPNTYLLHIVKAIIRIKTTSHCVVVFIS